MSGRTVSRSIAILLPTCDAYAAVAGFTLRRLNAWWPEHPDVYTCGLTRADRELGQCLPCTADPRDWVGIALAAVTRLGALGYEWLYLILDDHPPFGPCNADVLNRQLPEHATALDAIHVNLQGWDQYQPQEGSVLGPEHLCWQRNSPAFSWKFSLHPGYWHVATLERLLWQLRAQSPDARTARAFEGLMDGAARNLDPGLLGRTYRVRGDGFTAGERWFESQKLRAMTKPLIHVARVASRLGGRRALLSLDAALVPYFHYLNGPYPMFWSGLVRQGRCHDEALRFLEWSGQSGLAAEIRRLAFPVTAPACATASRKTARQG